MLDFQQKRKMRSLAYNKVTLVTLSLLALLTIHSVWSVYQKQRESGELLATAEKKVADLEARDISLKAKIANIKTEHGLEEEIRSKFNVAKADESVVVVTEAESATSSVQISISLWQKIVNFLTGR